MLYFNKTPIPPRSAMAIVKMHRGKLFAVGACGLMVGIVITRTTYPETLKSTIYAWLDGIKMKWNSLVLSWFSRREHNVIRDNFRRINMRKPDKRSKTENHSHGVAACVRSFANEFIENVALQSGYITYSVSMSTRDQLAEGSGQKYFYWPKDLQCEYRHDEVNENNLIKMIDVDYYVDMDSYLRKYDHIALFTFNPKTPGGSMANGTYSVMNDVVYCNINGGSKYSHRLYYYDMDQIYVRTWYGGKLFLVETKECPIHDADGKVVYTDYKVVLLSLKARVYGPAAWLFAGQSLRRRKITMDGFNITRSNEECNGIWCVYKHYSLPGSSSSVSIPEKLIEAAMIRCGRSKAPAISDVERLFREGDLVKDPAYAASIFMTIYSVNPNILSIQPLIVTKYIGSEYHYQTHAPLITEDGDESMRDLPLDIFPAAYAPRRSHNNDQACLEHRLFAVESKVTKIPPFYNQCIKEFIDYLLTPVNANGYATGKPRHWFLAPSALDDVAEKQNRPNQRAILDKAREWLFHGTQVVSAFQKSESYDSVNAPRNISNTSVDPKSRLAAYIYPLTDEIKQHHFYAFGHHPMDFSNSLHAKAIKTKFAICTDYSKFDGSHSLPLHEFELTLVLQAFPKQYHKEITSLMKGEVNAHCFTASGVHYTNGYSRLSGSMNTSIMNTLDNALISYISYRTMGYAPSDAYKKLGVYGGDDGVNFDLAADNLTKVTTKFGLSIKTETITASNPVYFLARCYPDIWVSPVSFCDVKRQVSKLHLTSTAQIVPDHVVYHRKFSSYLVTDPNTPIISDIANAVLKHLPKALANDHRYDDLIRDHQWWSQYESPFLTPARDDPGMLQIVLKQFELTPDEYQAWLNKLNDSKTLSEVLNCKLREVPAPDVKVQATLADQTQGTLKDLKGPVNQHANCMTLGKGKVKNQPSAKKGTTKPKSNQRGKPTKPNNGKANKSLSPKRQPKVAAKP